MELFTNMAIGWFIGFVFGVGCSLVVLYAIYQGGYRKAIADSLLKPLPDSYERLLKKAYSAQSSAHP